MVGPKIDSSGGGMRNIEGYAAANKSACSRIAQVAMRNNAKFQ
jgi:hypothetical protein